MTDGPNEPPPGDDHRPLTGWRVVVTGDVRRSADLGARLAALGAQVVELAVVAVEDPSDGGADLEAAAGRLAAGHYAWVAVTSAQAVDRLRAALGGRPVPPAVRWAAVGPSTARALERAGLGHGLVPPVATADALAGALAERPATGPLLYPRAERVRGDLAGRLRSAGWTVDDVVAYRTAGARPDPGALEAARRADAVLFASGSAVEEAVRLLGVEGVPPLVLTIGPSTSASARQAGLAVAAVAARPSGEELVGALVALSREHPKPP